jgi:hypothetical protein
MKSKFRTLIKYLALLCTVSLLVGTAACAMPFKIVPNTQPEEGPPPGEEFFPEEMEPEHEGEEPFTEEGEPHEEEPSDEVWIEFEAERTELQPGECTMLFWHVEGGGFGAFLNGEPVERAGEKEVCPDEPMGFFLEVDLGERTEGREIEIGVGVTTDNEPPPPGSGSSGGNCAGAPVISSFTASPSTINAGDKSRLEWGPVTNGNTAELVDSVNIDHSIGSVGSPGSSWASPSTTTTYTLTASGCGGTATKQVTVNVGGGSSGGSSGGSGGAFTTDIAVTDIYPGNQPQGQFHMSITNHGPGTLNKVVVPVICQGTELDLNTNISTGGVNQFDFKLSLTPGETQSYATGITFDFNIYAFVLECEVHPGFSDPNPGNNRYGEGFNGLKYIGP